MPKTIESRQKLKISGKMKKKCFLFIVLGAFALQLKAQESFIRGHKTYLDSTSVVNSLILLTPPPTPGTYEFFLDELAYFQGKEERITPRGEQAVCDAKISGDTILIHFTDAFGMEITKDSLPELYELMMCMKETAGTLGTMNAKRHYKRYRPFMYFNEHTATIKDENSLKSDGSYPSSHSAIFYSMALVLSEVNPDRKAELMERGFEAGRSRVIVGAHWASDVEAGRKVAIAVVDCLHHHKEFMEQLAKAKKEFEDKRKGNSHTITNKNK